jgi:hypothetical protein
VGLVYDPRGLPGVTTARPGVAGVLHAAIDQERLTKAVAVADEKKRKKMMPTSTSSGSSNGAPPKYRMVYTPPGGQLRRPQQWQNWGNRLQYQQ